MNKLEDLIVAFAQNKSEMDDLKKVCDDENKQIKKLMKESDLTEMTVGSWIAKYSIQKRDTINEDALLYLFSQAELRDELSARELGIIKSRDYVDMDALENAIYNGHVSNDLLLEMDKCKDIKEIEVLKVSRIKNKKEDK